ncbi:glycosyltransferase family 25 protein [Aliivibrio fischeri]|uniref:glycosyltransferase family 25 protein n=1 Tax=Aliivibrio fischeri TaxID=668 RepID=UPI0012DA84D3|nr:glycosyltransferase family 25 protein [Aliivibrio fischeri]MUK67960.1 hypothetical protein [Aliivibrio fischeri]MUK72907.1 hypothetical protein [Aliivibrio fischeri]
MNTYILSVKNSPRRNRFISFEHDYLFFDAVDVNVDDMKFFNKDKSYNRYLRDIRLNEISCTLSHVEMARLCLFNSSEWNLILEDDAIFLGDFKSLKEKIIYFKTDKPTILILGHSKTLPKFNKIQQLKQPLYDEFNIGDFIFGKKDINYCGTVSYLLNKGASEIMSNIEEAYWVADDWKVIGSLGIDIFHIKESIIYEEIDGISTTGNKLHIRHDIYKKPFSNMLSIIFNQIKRFLK